MPAIRNVSLAKERSSPPVYLVVGDVKFWVIDIVEFDALGFQWDKVRVVEDGALAHLRENRLHAPPTARPSDFFFDCGADYDAIDGKYYRNCQSSANLIRHHVLLAGWLEDAPHVNAASHGVEDVFFNVHLDAAFIDRMYGPGGLSSRLAGAVFPGNPVAPTPLPFPAAGRVTINSWVLPGTGNAGIHGELNAWHQQDTGSLFTSHWKGRGTAPAHWVNSLSEDTDAWFPFPPRDPELSGTPLRKGEYVIMRGPLWQDHAHYPPPSPPPFAPWDNGPSRNHTGWLEMHPIDWVVRVREPSTHARVTVGLADVCTALASGPPESSSISITPDFSPSAKTRRLEVRGWQGLIDDRLALGQTLAGLSVNKLADRLDVSVTVAPDGSSQGRFKGSWLVGWRELDLYDRGWIDDALPAGAQVLGDESWSWASADPEPYTGSVAHRSTVVAGLHQHYFENATAPMQVGAGDTLFAMVYLDPDNPPEEVMLQWHSTGWLHRAYWGADRIGWGAPGTAERRLMGPLPYAGEWVRLEVPAGVVGLEGRSVTGMAFTLFDGRATWDYAGTRVPVPSSGVLRLQVSRSRLTEGLTRITVFARDTGTGTPVAGRAFIDDVDEGATNLPFELDLGSGRHEVRATCPGYPNATTFFTVRAVLN
jgi:hypothetical protein